MHAQVANDGCAGAINLGTLGTPVACNGSASQGLGAVSTFNLTNNGALPENPYTFLTGCQPANAPMPNPAADVWYVVTVTGNELFVNISGLTTPTVGVYTGGCGSLTGRGCAVGAAGSLSASFDQMVPGGQVWLQISGGNAADQGNFTLTLRNNNSCDDCMLQSTLTANPPPINGTYQNGTTVTFCFTVSDWYQRNTNWFHGVVPTFGPGWDLSSLTNLVPAASCDGDGTWGWYNSVTSSATGSTFGPGFFYESVAGGSSGTNPGDNFGDNCGQAGTSVNANPNWTFCWTITVDDCPPGSSGDNLDVTINTLGDGESGGWNNIACTGDPEYEFKATLTCCPGPIMSQVNNLCSGDNDGIAIADPQGTGPWAVTWTSVPGGTTLQTDPNVTGPDSLQNLPNGTYAVEVFDSFDFCLTRDTLTITSPAALSLNMSKTDGTCGQANGSASVAVSGGAGGNTFAWSNGANTATISNIQGGNYIVTVTDNNGCTAVDSIVVNSPVAPSIFILNLRNVTCNGAADAYAVADVFGGTAPLTYAWSNSGSTDSIGGLGPGSYSLTVTDANSCADTAVITITEPSALNINISSQNISCNGNADGHAVASYTGGNGNFSLQWSTGSTQDSIGALAPGTYIVTVSDTSFSSSGAQMVWFEGFEGNPNWTLNVPTGVNGADNNFWQMDDDEGGVLPPGCGVGNNGDQTLHITSVFCPSCGAAYDAGGSCPALFCPQTNMRAESPVINTTGFSNLLLEFDFISMGDNLLDNASVLYNDGGGWTVVNPSIKTPNCPLGQGQWTGISIPLPPSTWNNPNLQIGFNWTNNDDGLGTDPSVAINNVRIVTPSIPDTTICTAVDSVTITQPSPLVLAFDSIPVLCNGDSNGLAVALPSGGNGNYSFLWSNGSTNDTISGLPAGTYVVTITDTAHVSSGGSISNIVLYEEDFDAPLSIWNLTVQTGVNGANANFWQIDDDEGGVLPPGCGVANNGDSTLHITSQLFPTAGAAYDAGGLCALLGICPETNVRAQSPVFSTVGATNVSLGFDFISMGQGLIDNASVWYNDGSGWTILTNSIKTSNCISGQGQWTAYTNALPASCWNNPTVQVGINWSNNDDGVGTDPSVAINNLIVNGQTTGGGGGNFVLCTLIDSVTITEPAVLSLATSSVDVSCNGLSNGSAAVVVSGGTPGYQIGWSNFQTGDSISGLSAGVYTVAVVDTNGCTDSASVTINQPAPLGTTVTGTDALCNGDSSGCAEVAVVGGSGNFVYTWSNGMMGDSICGLPAGMIYVTVSDTANGLTNCTVTDSIIIGEPAALTLTPDSVSGTCGLPNGIAIVVASGGTPGTTGYTYVWNTSPVQNTDSASGLAAGMYQVVIADSNGCTDSAQISIGDLAGPVIAVDTVIDESCFGYQDGSAAVSVSGGNGTLNITWTTNPVQTGPVATNLTNGNYFAVVSDSNNCLDSAAISINSAPQIIVNLQVNSAACGQGTGTAIVSASGGAGGFTYQWSTSPVQTADTITGLPPGNYTVTVTDGNGCTETAVAVIQNTPGPSATIQGVSNVLCNGGNDGQATAFSASGTLPFTYLWSDGQLTQTATGLSAGTYSVTITDVNGCADSTTVFITEPQPITGNLTTTQVSCNATSPDGTAFISVTGGAQPYNFLWGGGQTGNYIQNLPAGPVSVTVTDANGCQVVFNDIIGEEPRPTAVAGPAASFCEGEGGAQIFVTGSGGTQPYYYTWWCDSTNTYCGLDSVFDNDPIANPTVSTWYYVQITDNNGCVSNIDSVFVTVLPKPVVDAGPDQYICGDSAPCVLMNPVVTGAPGPFSYQWSPSSGLSNDTIANPCVRPDSTTIYTLLVTAANGCQSWYNTVDTNSTVIVHVNPIPVAEAGPERDLCLGDSLQLQGYGYGAGPQYDFEWTPSNGLSSTTIQNPMASPSQTIEYVLVVWSNNCPSYGDTVVVNVHTIPTVDAGPDVEVCLGDTALLDAQAWGDSTSPNYQFMWVDGTGAVGPQTDEDYLTAPDTTHTYYVTATSIWGCESPQDSATVYVKPTPIAEAGPQQVICLGDTASLQGGYYYTTTGPVQNPTQIWYSWTPGATLSDTTVADPDAWPFQSQFYYLTVQYNTCITTDSVLVTVIPDVNGSADADTSVICQLDSVQLTSSGGLGGASFTWYPSSGLSDPNIPNPVAAPDSSTEYYVVIEEGGCSDTLFVPIQVLPTPLPSYLNSVSDGCVPHTVNFVNTTQNGIFYVWDFGDGAVVTNEMNPEHTYTQPGDYPVTLTAVSVGGCEAAATQVLVHVADSASAEFVSNPEYPVQLTLPNTDVSFFDRSDNAHNWLWDFGDGRQSTETDPAHQFLLPGQYFVTLTVTSEEGCLSRVTHGPYVVLTPELMIPNVFSPNNDGVNDRWIVDYSGNQPTDISVYDRWGALMYQSRNKVKGWDGRDEVGNEVPEGVYYYHVVVGNREFAGEVTLLR